MSHHVRIPVCLVTDAHSVIGLLETDGRRVLEVLNDLTTGFLELSEVRSQRLGAQREFVTLPRLLTCKSEITVCAIMQDKHEAAQRRMDAYVPKVPHEIYVLAGACQCQGTISLRGNPDPVQAMQSEFGLFFPITDANLQCGVSELHAKVVLVNRARVAAIQFGAAKPSREATVSLAS